jgi:hypothetical protein
MMRVLFKRADDEPMFVGQLIRSEIPTVICGACGRGICFPVVGQSCSNNCGAYVFEVMSAGQGRAAAMCERVEARRAAGDNKLEVRP